MPALVTWIKKRRPQIWQIGLQREALGKQIMAEYDDKKWSGMLAHLESESVYAKLTDWEKRFLGPCLEMNDKKIALSDKQRPILAKIWEKYKQCG